ILSISLSVILLLSIVFFSLSVVLINDTIAKQIIDIFTIVFITIFIIMNITLSLFIMIFKWINNWCIENKLLWGILNLIVLPFIASLIFAIKGKKYSNLENNNKSLYLKLIEEPFDIKLIDESDLED
ncbi:MAG: hypothetical protein K2L64_00345, partial [Ureaplasma sp.]|nr:hypothetical protein [Ureaplasma sp.]